MQKALIRKLEGYEELSDQDRWALNGLVTKVRHVGARVDLIHEGDAPENVHLILDGFACRYKVLPNGQRQIMAFLVPGDFCDLNVFILDQMDHSIGTISACQVVDIPRQAIEEITANHPRITRALWWCNLVDEAVLREWLVNLGSRQADERIAHLLCELLVRLEAVGLVRNDCYGFPFTQTDIADTMGLSNVHVNRTYRELRDTGLITLKHRILTIHDAGQLKAYCGFNPNYLHLMNTRWKDRRNLTWLNQARSS
ncbi:cyclic nucleotide-binding protein [Methylorubrum extorquens]|uniref:Cyclic nucleotide-binding protein n=1 Tax=Methylorubrum extorquens TaxID=408 RepID=A0A1S1P2V4_METEX|nr:cyclic nucleotide-binding protein [Methylorubrum extorquens]